MSTFFIIVSMIATFLQSLWFSTMLILQHGHSCSLQYKPNFSWCSSHWDYVIKYQIDFLINTPFSGVVLFYTEDTIDNEKNTTPTEQFYIIIRNLIIIFGTWYGGTCAVNKYIIILLCHQHKVRKHILPPSIYCTQW